MFSNVMDFEDVSLEFLPAILRGSGNLIFAKDSEFRIIYANDVFLNIYPPEVRTSILGKTTAENFSELEAQVFFAEDRKVFREGYSELIENIVDFNGDKKVYHIKKIRYISKTGEACLVGIGIDITQMAIREQKIAENNIQLQKFAQIAAHDLRSPLSSISLSLDMISMDKSTSLSIDSKNYMDLIKSSISGLLHQIENTLNIQKSKDDADSSFQECDTKIVFEEVRYNLSKKINDNSAAVLSSNLPTIDANKALIRQLFQNLIENSLKFKSDLMPVIIVRAQDKDDCYEFSVEDNGIGISNEKDPDRLFLMNERSDGTDVEGLGIGLSVCRKIVEMHGGKIWFDKAERESGCKICFTLPIFQFE